MLSPDQIEEAGDAVAAIYTDIEAKMLDRLVETLIDGVDLKQMDNTARAVLSQTHANELRTIIEEYAPTIKKAIRQTVTSMLKASDADDVKRLGEGRPIYLQQVEATIEGVAYILARDNIQMVEGAKRAFLDASIEAVTNVNTGMMTTERALHHAVRNLERKGIPIITYQNSKTGRITVENKVDVAVRRHIRTQIAQDGARLTMDRINDLDIALVEVSSHCGARPEHAEWQGRCYSLHGDTEIEGVKYPDLCTATGYGSVDGLLGANCRHSFGPYRHGAPRAYENDPKHESGLPNDEIYEMTQKQRYLERRIREAKREVRGMQQLHDSMGTLESRANLAKAQQRLKDRQRAMREFIAESNAKSKTGKPILHRKPNREWAGDMPKSKTVKMPQLRSASNYPERVESKEKAITLAKKNKRPAFCLKGDPLIKDVENIRLGENLYHVTMHGIPGNALLYGYEITAKEFAEVLRAREDYHGEDIALRSCSLGDERYGIAFAQELASELGVNVVAATRKIWANGGKDYIIGDRAFSEVGKGFFKLFSP